MFQAAVLGALFSLNTPGGHALIHEASLQIAFEGAVRFARAVTRNPDFTVTDLRSRTDLLQMYFAADVEGARRAAAVLNAPSPFSCLPGAPGSPQAPTPSPACHAARPCSDEDDAAPVNVHPALLLA